MLPKPRFRPHGDAARHDRSSERGAPDEWFGQRQRRDPPAARSARRRARPCVPVERATMLPPAAFTDPSVLAWEIENVFAGWVCIGHVSAVAEPGSYLMREIGPTSVFATARRGRRASAPSSTSAATAARGSSTETEGSVRKRIQCPYHAWSYDLDGSLVAAPHMDEVEDFDRSLLRPARGPLGGRRRPAAGRPQRRGAGPAEHVGDCSASSSSATGSPALQRAARHRLRRRGELEGDRRELQRVPALSRRPSGAERAQRLPQRRGRLRRRALVRRLDDAERGRRDDGASASGHATTRPPIARPRRRRTSTPSTTSRCSRTRWSRCTPTT